MLSAKPVRIAYCDYIAHLISSELKALDDESERLLAGCGRVQNDFGLDELRSTIKTVDVLDRFGKSYRITIQEL